MLQQVKDLHRETLDCFLKPESPKHVDATKFRGLTLEHASSGQSDAPVWDVHPPSLTRLRNPTLP